MPLVITPNLVLVPGPHVAAPVSGAPLILWDNKVTTANLESTNAALNFPVINVANPSTNLEWQASASGTVEVRAVSVGSIDAVGIARHNFGTAGIAVEIGYYTGGTTWVSVAGPINPSNNEPLLFYFTSINVAKVVVKLYAGSQAARMAVLYVGTMLKMSRSVDINPDFIEPRFGRRTEFQAGRSDRGDYLGRIVTSQWLDGVDHVFKHLDPTWYRDKMEPFVRAAQQDVPFFYCMRPDDYPAEVSYMWLQDDPVTTVSPATLRNNVTLRMGGILE